MRPERARASPLGIDADERGRPRGVVGCAVDDNVAVEGHLTGSRPVTPLPHPARIVSGNYERSVARPRHVERDLVCPTEIVPRSSFSNGGDRPWAFRARYERRGTPGGPAQWRAVEATCPDAPSRRRD